VTIPIVLPPSRFLATLQYHYRAWCDITTVCAGSTAIVVPGYGMMGSEDLLVPVHHIRASIDLSVWSFCVGGTPLSASSTPRNRFHSRLTRESQSRRESSINATPNQAPMQSSKKVGAFSQRYRVSPWRFKIDYTPQILTNAEYIIPLISTYFLRFCFAT
jgi:hypothetical protein